jgi:energy-coupling factor transport system ATP-binding protein
MLRLESVSYRYAGASRASLVDVSLELRDGEVVGVMGASDAGKTTLCLVASGLAPRVIRGTLSGRLTVDGADMIDKPMHELATLVAIAFQNPSTQLSGVCDTVFEEVAFGPANLGLPLGSLIERVEGSLRRLHIEDLAERDPARLSGGQQQLVALAGALAMRPRHLVLDEPTAQLDPHGTRLVMDALAELAADGGASILIAEHKTDELAAVCTRIVVLDAGRVALEGEAGLVDDPRLRQLGVAEPAAGRLRRHLVEDDLDPGLVA